MKKFMVKSVIVVVAVMVVNVAVAVYAVVAVGVVWWKGRCGREAK